MTTTGKLDYESGRLKAQESLIFLSYAKEDKTRVKAIYRRLRTEHLNPWLDVANLLPGEDWDKVISTAIRSARFVIVFLSTKSINKRGYVQKEIREALDVADTMPEGEIFIIPVRLEECVVPTRLSKWQWIDIFKPYGFTRILKTLRENLVPESAFGSRVFATAKVIVMGVTDHEAMFALNSAVSLIGRASRSSKPDVDLARFDPNRMVSRRHALVFREGNSLLIKDCGSTNGTIINDSVFLGPNRTKVLRNGDQVRLGDVVLHFVTEI